MVTIIGVWTVVQSSWSGIFFERCPHMKQEFLKQIHGCMEQLSTLEAHFTHIYHCLINKLFLCQIRYDSVSETETVTVYNIVTRSRLSHNIAHLHRQVLPPGGHLLPLCGVFGNVLPFLKPWSWTITTHLQAIINIMWLKFDIPLTKPDCNLIGVRVRSLNTERPTSVMKSEVFCGTLKPWNIFNAAKIQIDFFNKFYNNGIGPYGFYLSYILEDKHKLYVQQIHNYEYIYQFTPYNLHTSFTTDHLGVWPGKQVQTWHMISSYIGTVIQADCHGRLSTARHNDKLEVSFHDGPGSLSPIINTLVAYGNQTLNKGMTSSNTFHMFISAVYPLRQTLLQCSYKHTLSLEKTDKCFSKVVKATHVFDRPTYQIGLDKNYHGNIACVFWTSLYTPATSFQVVKFQFESWNEEYIRHDMNTMNDHLCLYGGLYVDLGVASYPIPTWTNNDNDKLDNRVFQLCSSVHRSIPEIVLQGSKVFINFITYKGYSSGQMLISLQKVLKPCLTVENKAFNMHIPFDDLLHQQSLQGKESMYQTEVNRLHQCLQIIHLLGQENVLTTNNNTRVIKFFSYLGSGPTMLDIHYFPINVLSYRKRKLGHLIWKLQIGTQDGRHFHPKLPAIHKTTTFTSGHWKHKSLNLIALTIREPIQSGSGHVMIVMLFKDSHCTPQMSQHSKTLTYYNIHKQVKNYNIFQVETKIAEQNGQCFETMLDYIGDHRHMVTEVVIKKASSTIEIQLLPQSLCKPNETVTIFESNSHLGIVYRFIFRHTANRKVMFVSRPATDIHVIISKIFQPNSCIGTAYEKVIIAEEKQDQPSNDMFEHYPAR